jgi:hypothetical protein
VERERSKVGNVERVAGLAADTPHVLQMTPWGNGDLIEEPTARHGRRGINRGY